MAMNDDHSDLRSRIQQLKDDHQALKAQLLELRDRPYLTVEEQIEVRTLQKMKLMKKDSLAMLLSVGGHA
ncbi:MAG: hypothetical protein CMH55_02325 [Myxococcales bacterium]|nr:hypothetical protein [Myxococcales bacterium]|tara:strand:- start:2565 stop:2774 length:210 start_codon:yes stop_codon:yes gene_type:complete